MEEMRQFCSRFTGWPSDKLFHCGSGLGTGCVDAYGRFQPCMLLRHPEITCDLKKQSLKDALTKRIPEMRQMKAKNPEYLARCADPAAVEYYLCGPPAMVTAGTEMLAARSVPPERIAFDAF